MARRSTKKSENDTPQAEEANVSTTTEEAAVQTDDLTVGTDPEATPATQPESTEAEIDLSAFQSAVEAAVAERDTSTGDVPEAHFSTINGEYRKLEGAKAKNKAKALLTEGITAGMNALDAPLARSYMVIQEHLSASGPKGTSQRAERTPVDPTEAFVEQVTTLNLARALVQRPEGVAEDADAKANALYSEQYGNAETFLAWFQSEDENKGDEPDVPVYVKNAVKLALGRSAKAGGPKRQQAATSTYTGERRDIAKHIAEAFAGEESGKFLSIAEIRKFNSSEYGDDHPSAGAISARLFPKSGKVTIEGITSDEQDGKKGAVKA